MSVPMRRMIANLALYAAGLALLGAAALGMRTLAQRSQARADPRTLQATLSAGPTVAFVPVGLSSPDRTRVLLGEARPYAATVLYAKVSGYLHEIKVDRGDHVEAGQLIAVIDSPELDTQVHAAEIDARNRRVLADRARRLAVPGIVSEQEAQQAEASAGVAGAQVRAAQQQRDYRRIHAPFSGIITARYADPGAMVQAATGSQTTALPVVRLAQIDKLRVFLYLDQVDAAIVRVGDDVDVGLAGGSGDKVPAKIARVSGELDAKTRTMVAEVDLDNREGRFAAGSFVQISLHLHLPVRPEIPTEALLVRGQKSFVAVLGAGDHIEMREVQVGDHDGQRVQLLSGVHPGEKVAVSLGDAAQDGQRVQPVAAPEPAAKAKGGQ